MRKSAKNSDRFSRGKAVGPRHQIQLGEETVRGGAGPAMESCRRSIAGQGHLDTWVEQGEKDVCNFLMRDF